MEEGSLRLKYLTDDFIFNGLAEQVMVVLKDVPLTHRAENEV